MKMISNMLEGARSVVILGHVRPDGDCVGSCLGLRNYLKNLEPSLEVQVYLQVFSESFLFLQGAEEISHDPNEEKTFDLCFVLDCGDESRLGEFSGYLGKSKRSICIDHHITNTGFSEVCVIEPHAAATSEILVTLMEEEKIDQKTAECLYLGIVHDTGVFKHSNTTRRTMEIAGMLLEKGAESAKIIDGTFYEKTYLQNQILGRLLTESTLSMNGFVIASSIDKKTMELFGADSRDLDGVIDQLRITKGVDTALLISETKENEWKLSMRSKKLVDVSKIAASFGGGGHIRAAGCSMKGSRSEVLEAAYGEIRKQLTGCGVL